MRPFNNEMSLEDFAQNLFSEKLQEEFLRKRKIFLWGPVHDRSAKEIISKMLYLSAEDSSKDIEFFIHSPGGIISSGLAIVDCMEMIEPDVATICMGLCASMGAILLACGKKGKRYIWPHGKVMIHQPLISGQIVAPAIDIKIHAEEIKKTRNELNRILSQRTGQTLKKIEKDTDRDFYLNAQESIEYGIVDHIYSELKLS